MRKIARISISPILINIIREFLVSQGRKRIKGIWAEKKQYCKAKDREETGRMRGREESTRGQKEKKSLFIPITNNSYQLFYF